MSNKDPNFLDCINDSNESNKNLLLGNGFSISLHKKFESSEFSNFSNEHMKQLFNILKTTDFEKVMESILNTKDILVNLEPDLGNKFDIERYTEEIKEEFLRTIEKIHPKNQSEIQDKISISKAFINRFDYIFTLNYDLMLYWIIMDSKTPPHEIYPDGFRSTNQLLWQRPDEQRLFFLHGALHLHTSNEIGLTVKNSFKRTGIPLRDQLTENLAKGEWPMIVLEGKSEQKLKAIYGKPYLDYSLKFLKTIKDCLFIHGCSFKEQDAHIYDAIFSNQNLTNIYIGRLEDDIDLEKNIKARTKNFSSAQEKIRYYNAKSICS